MQGLFSLRDNELGSQSRSALPNHVLSCMLVISTLRPWKRHALFFSRRFLRLSRNMTNRATLFFFEPLCLQHACRLHFDVPFAPEHDDQIKHHDHEGANFNRIACENAFLSFFQTLHPDDVASRSLRHCSMTVPRHLGRNFNRIASKKEEQKMTGR